MVSGTGNLTVMAARLEVFICEQLGSVSQMAGTTQSSTLVRESRRNVVPRTKDAKSF
jgi:hypothetical protein